MKEYLDISDVIKIPFAVPKMLHSSSKDLKYQTFALGAGQKSQRSF